jgi:hypothetical protein
VRRLLTHAAVASAALTFSAPALAQDSPPAPDDSAISQYVEGVPGAGGTKTPGIGKRAKPRPLSPAIRAELKSSGGADAQVLQRLATAPNLGAPARPRHAQRAVIRPSAERSSATGALSAAVTAAGDGGGTRFTVLALGLLGITAGVLGSARRRVRP